MRMRMKLKLNKENKMKQLLLILSIITLSISCSEINESNQSKNEKQHPKPSHAIDSLFNTYGDEFMGSIALFQNGDVIYSQAIGFDDTESKKKSTTNTKYRIGSISKTFTAVLIFKAIEENKLSLDQTIASYFPEVSNADKITVAHLLQHRSGIHNYTEDERFFEYHTKYKSPAEMLAMISKYNSEFEPNNKGEYSNSNYFLLAQILEKIYGLPYEALLKEKICTPLKLEDTYVGSNIQITNNECYSYKYVNDWTQLPETDMSVTAGAGSIVSRPEEVNRFIEALFTGKLITNKNLKLMKTIKDGYGMGLAQYKINDRVGFGHRGSLDGFKSTAIYFPGEKLILTITSNGSNDNIHNIFTEVLKLYIKDPVIKISEAEVKKYTGTYGNPQEGPDKYIFSNNKSTLIHHIKEFRETLNYKGNHRFVLEQMYAEPMSFTFSPDGEQLTVVQGDYKGTFSKE